MGILGGILDAALAIGVTALSNKDNIETVKDVVSNAVNGNNSGDSSELDEIEKRLRICQIKLDKISNRCSNTPASPIYKHKITQETMEEFVNISYEIKDIEDDIDECSYRYSEDKSQFETEDEQTEERAYNKEEYLSEYREMLDEFEDRIRNVDYSLNETIEQL